MPSRLPTDKQVENDGPVAGDFAGRSGQRLLLAASTKREVAVGSEFYQRRYDLIRKNVTITVIRATKRQRTMARARTFSHREAPTPTTT